jgi:hypothetical protein
LPVKPNDLGYIFLSIQVEMQLAGIINELLSMESHRESSNKHRMKLIVVHVSLAALFLSDGSHNYPLIWDVYCFMSGEDDVMPNL